jgi:hypothetical protein
LDEVVRVWLVSGCDVMSAIEVAASTRGLHEGYGAVPANPRFGDGLQDPIVAASRSQLSIRLLSICVDS